MGDLRLRMCGCIAGGPAFKGLDGCWDAWCVLGNLRLEATVRGTREGAYLSSFGNGGFAFANV